MRHSISATLTVLAVLVAPAVALAAEPGVHVDPGSPSGKEYALPFEQARHGAGGPPSAQHPGSGGGSSQAPAAADPRFGQGITPARAERAHRTTGRAGAHGAGSSARRTTAVTASAALPTPGGSSSSSWVLGGTGAVALLGGALALALRRRGPGRLHLDGES